LSHGVKPAFQAASQLCDECAPLSSERSFSTPGGSEADVEAPEDMTREVAVERRPVRMADLMLACAARSMQES
jgi:hypothetical protein